MDLAPGLLPPGRSNDNRPRGAADYMRPSFECLGDCRAIRPPRSLINQAITVLLLVVLAVDAAADPLDPLGILEVPLDRGSQALVK